MTRLFLQRLLPGLFLLFIINSSKAQSANFLSNIYSYIENPDMIELNQEPGHVPLLPYSGLEEALGMHPENSSGYLSLNGLWKFLYAENPDKANKNFFLNNFSESGMDEIIVPGNWQMQGYGDKIFRNIHHAFKADPPKIPHDYNPTGSYRKTFVVPANWRQKQIFLHFEAVSSAFFVWVNGQEVGYNQGSMEPAEFDVTRFVKPGKNTVSVMVFMYSDGTYNEDQDMWRLSGIFRNVYLMATPRLHIRDYYVTTDLDEKYQNAILSAEVDIKNYGDVSQKGFSLRATVVDQQGHPVIENLQSERFTLEPGGQTSVKLTARVNNPEKWSAEKPNLYKIAFELVSPEGKTTEALADRIGFREVEVKHQVLYVNGVAVKLNGVNSHMQHPDLGHAMNIETMRKDLLLMKQFNINCVRTSHYPPNKEYLQLADELGLYIIDETNDEAHATEYISDWPMFAKSYVERAEKMVLRDRNHPSIIIWSAGNESGSGENICEVINAGRRLDPSRPAWMYGGNAYDAPGFNPIECENLIGPRYGTPFELKVRYGESPEKIDPRPSFMDEYVAATGNGAGGLDEYWEVIYEYPRLSGGAIWDFVSPGLRERYMHTPDVSPYNNPVNLMGKATLTNGKFGKAVQLSGTDAWVELYQSQELDIVGKSLTLSMWVKPGEWNGNGSFLTKGSYQYGLEQLNEKELAFYIGDKKREQLVTPLPENWENHWHQLTATFDGMYMKLFIDGKPAGQRTAILSIENKPFQVCIGRNAEIHGQEHDGHLSNAAFDQVAIFNQVIDPGELLYPSNELKNKALLWLDFDSIEPGQEFFSTGIGGRTYGLIWPDRNPQPELWQVKKSAQPVSVKLIDPAKWTVEITNRHHFTDLKELQAKWQIQEEGEIIKEGTFDISLPAQQKGVFTIPVPEFKINPDKSYFLNISFLSKTETPWASKGFEIAWDQFGLNQPAIAPAPSNKPVAEVKETGTDLVISGKNFQYAFDVSTGKLSSIIIDGTEILKKGPELSVWRAPLANDLDDWTVGRSGLDKRQPGMGNGPSNEWFSLGLNDLKPVRGKMSWSNIGDAVVVDVYSHALAQGQYATTFENHYIYWIEGSGRITIDHTVTPSGQLPEWLPKVGLEINLRNEFQQVKWFGRGPFETYPDRKTGAKVGVYQTSVPEMYEPYLIPQESGNRTDVRWVEFKNPQGTGIRISADQLFSFSASEYSTDNVSRALYPYQLQKQGSVRVDLNYAISGVGCTAISTLQKYKVMPTEYHRKVIIEPIW